jgi:hypothetical protein
MKIIKIICSGNEGHYSYLTTSAYFNILCITKGVYFSICNEESQKRNERKILVGKYERKRHLEDQVIESKAESFLKS